MERHALKWFAVIGAVFSACSNELYPADTVGDSNASLTATALDCEVAIVGGGAGGLHTAYKLTNPPSGQPSAFHSIAARQQALEPEPSAAQPGTKLPG